MKSKNENDYAAWLTPEKTVNTSIEITRILKLGIKKTKRLFYGLTLIMSLVGENVFH